jgi:hypothetical protein
MRLTLALIVGFVVDGIVGSFAMSHAECCGMFDVDLNTQLEIGRQEQERLMEQPLLEEPYRLPQTHLFDDPCLRP